MTFLILLVLTVGCRKDTITELSSRHIELPQKIRIHAIHEHASGRISIAGGLRLNQGWYGHSEDHGISWSCVQLSNQSSIYCMAFANDSLAWLGGDSLKLWKKTPQSDWHFHWLGSQVPMHEADRPAVRDIMLVGDSAIRFVSGDYYTKGICYASNDAGATWNYSQSPSAQNRLYLLEDQVLTCGYGSSMRYSSAAWHHVHAIADDLTGVVVDATGKQWAASSTGRIYSKQKSNNEWTVSKPTKQNDVMWLCAAQQGEIFAFGGSQGEILISPDAGDSWHLFQLSAGISIFSMAIHSNEIWCGSDDGSMEVAQIPF
jgi:hypothetical protein